MSHSIFISYRRLDSEPEAGRLLTTLQRELRDAVVFMDTVSILPGADWPETIREALEYTTTMLVLIGPNWLRAGSDEWGRRPIDNPGDWVRREVEFAIAHDMLLIPVLVRDAAVPPDEVLPESMRALNRMQCVGIRGQYWDHDVKLLLRQLDWEGREDDAEDSRFDPYPVPPPETIDEIGQEKLDRALQTALKDWKKVISELPEDRSKVREELFREYKFPSFQVAIEFMSVVAKGCDVANHHPRWENVWKTLRVYLTTWNIGHRISDRDVQLAKYFDSAYSDFMKRSKSQ